MLLRPSVPCSTTAAAVAEKTASWVSPFPQQQHNSSSSSRKNSSSTTAAAVAGKSSQNCRFLAVSEVTLGSFWAEFSCFSVLPCQGVLLQKSRVSGRQGADRKPVEKKRLNVCSVCRSGPGWFSQNRHFLPVSEVTLHSFRARALVALLTWNRSSARERERERLRPNSCLAGRFGRLPATFPPGVGGRGGSP